MAEYVSKDRTDAKQGGLPKAIRQNEEGFRLLIEAVRDYAIFILDSNGCVASWNAGAERIKQYTAEEIVGRHFSTFYPPDAIARGWPEHELDEARKAGRFEDEGWRIRKDGSRFWAGVVITALFDEESHLWGYAKVVQDLTERREVADAMERARLLLEDTNRMLLERNQELQDFAHVASHDLQEPLRKVSTFARMLAEESGPRLSESSLDYLARIRDATGRMSQLITDLLKFSRIATGADFTEVNLAVIISEVLSDLEVRIRETGALVEVSELPSVEADPSQMRQLFQNLIGNALKFHKPDVPPIVRISVAPPADDTDANHCRIVISDNGIGFEEKYRDRIFVPFLRLHTRTEYEGTGIGLAIVRRIALRHGGTVLANSTPGEGTTFIISLPVRHTPEQEQSALP